MKILMLADVLDVGGAETHIETLARELKKRGNLVAVASRGGRIAEKMRKSGLSHANLQRSSGKSGKNTSFALEIFLDFVKISRVISKNRPDIVHAHTRKTAFLAKPVCRALKIPLIVTAHAKFSMKFPKAALSVWGDRTIAVSEDVARHVASHSAHKNLRISVINNGISLESEQKKYPRDEKMHLAELKIAKKRVIFVSRLDGDCSRGAYILCEIAPYLYKKYPEIQFLIVGGGREFEKIKQKAEETNRNTNRELIKMLGYVENPSQIYQKGDLFVGVSRAAPEAMARGCAAVLLGDEGYLGLLDERSVSAARRTNFTCRAE